MKDFFSKKNLGSFINNEFHVDSKSLKSCLCKVTNKPLFNLSPLEEKDIAFAIISAEKAFSSYKYLASKERIKLLKKAYQLLMQNKDQVAKLITSEMGKTITEAKAEVDYSAGYFSHYAELLKKPSKNQIPSLNPNKKLYSLYEPVGVCGFITPRNFPLAMPVRKIAAALATGCTCVIKPSPETPFTMLFLASLLKKAGFPSGSCQVLIGDEKK